MNFATTKQRIIQYIEFKGINITTFLKETEIKRGFLDSDKLESSVSDAFITKIIETYPDIDVIWLLTGKGEMQKREFTTNSLEIVDKEFEEKDDQIDFIPLIPIDAMAGYGTGEVQISRKKLLKGYKIPEFKQRGVEYIIRVSGSSMYPKYSSGDLLGCKTVRDTSFFQWGKIYVLDTDQGPMVKRLFPVPDNDEYLECRSDNKDYPPFKIHKESIYNVAIVIGVLRME
ncbi:S24 family peptidase [Flavobacterium oreochromis]|nr:S24 family peptidase [Flavobacterium oreochromis]